MAAGPLPPHLQTRLRGLSQTEFRRFYRADRRVYSRLVVNLNRDVTLSVHVVALWMWMETAGRNRTHIATLVGWPDSVLNALADEAVECLICMHRDEFRPPPGRGGDMCFTQNLTNRGIGLGFFHKHRAVILEEMRNLIDEVCVVAFFDIMHRVAVSKARARYATAESSNFSNPSERGSGDQSVYLISPVPYRGVRVGSPNVPSSFIPVFKKGGFLDLLFSEMFEQQAQTWDDDYFLGAGKAGDSPTQHEAEVPADERTIFLTFSKGYPIPETEVREYFTRRFGNFIEELHMQEVAPEEQPLYARLVVRPASIIGSVLNGKSKAKFTINGKHVWARRYVRKDFKLPSTSAREVPSPPTQP